MQGALTGLKYTAVGTGAIYYRFMGCSTCFFNSLFIKQAYMKKGKSLNLKNALDIKEKY